MNKQLLSALVLGVATTGVATAQANDDCAGAIAVGLGTTAIDTSLATTSPEVWPCALGGSDLWYTYTAANDNDIVLSLCGSSYDTAIEAFTGSCGSLVSVGCNDDACGLQSTLVIGGVTSGTTYTFRVGGFNGAAGLGTLDVSESTPPPPPPMLTPGSVETLYAANNGGSAGGAVYFDVTAINAADIGTVFTNYDAVAGSPVGIEVYTTPGTHVGNENDPSVWTLVANDDGNAVSAGLDTPSVINLAAPFTIPSGTMGIALVSVGDGHRYTNGTGANQQFSSMNGNLTVDLGVATNVPFTGGIFSPRVWNGALIESGPGAIGVPYCTAVVNSTGNAGEISASGSATASDNDFTLTASGMPAMQFGIFLTSLDQAATPVASGTLCLGGNVIRFQGAGQILQADMNGEFSLMIDLTSIPAGVPTTVVAGDVWNYTAWFRDVDPMMGNTANFTNGLEVTFN